MENSMARKFRSVSCNLFQRYTIVPCVLLDVFLFVITSIFDILLVNAQNLVWFDVTSGAVAAMTGKIIAYVVFFDNRKIVLLFAQSRMVWWNVI